MLYRVIKMEFKQPLTDEQEDILVNSFQQMVERFLATLLEIKNKIGKQRVRMVVKFFGRQLGDAAITILSTKLDAIIINKNFFFKLDRTDDFTSYSFKWAHKEVDLSKISGFPIPGGKAFSEDKMIEGLKIHILPQMTLTPDDVRFSVLDEEIE